MISFIYSNCFYILLGILQTISLAATNFYVSNDIIDSEILISNIPSVEGILHVFTHGRSGELLIHGEWKDASELKHFFKGIINESDIYHMNIYGCEFGKGQKGLNAIKYLEDFLGLSISASDNITGKDGDWILEIGTLCHYNFQAQYPYNLQTDECMGQSGITSFDLGKGLTHVSGTHLTAGAQYRIDEVDPAGDVDILLTIVSISRTGTNAHAYTFRDLNYQGGGIATHLQPHWTRDNAVFSIGNTTIELELFFELSASEANGTTVDPVTRNFVLVTIDNDGYSTANERLYEEVEYSPTANGYALNDPTSQTQNGNVFSGPYEVVQGINTNPEHSNYAYYENTSSFTWISRHHHETIVPFDFPYTGDRLSSFGSNCMNPANQNFQDPLPIEILGLSAEQSGSDVRLSWATANEINNDKFELEYSFDGQSFSRFEQVFGQGTTSSIHNYQAIHQNAALLWHDQLYYRLKQVDFDGTYQYSNIVSLQIKRSGKQVQIFPNPVVKGTDNFVSVSADKLEHIAIINSFGIRVFDKRYEKNEAEHIPIKEFIPGIYSVVVNNNAHPIKFIVY